MEINKGGAPIKSIDYEVLDKMCALQCTGEECASMLCIDYDTLNAGLKRDGFLGFSDYFKQNSSKGKISLRKLQFDSAKGGNATMLIWLGKQWLGQEDKSKFDIAHSLSDDFDALLNDAADD